MEGEKAEGVAALKDKKNSPLDKLSTGVFFINSE
jgi:hypothetical protein